MRKAIPPKIRFQVLNRDNFECKYCWLKAGNWVQLQVDHIIPIKDWWSNDIDNLICSCFECNIGKWWGDVNKPKKDIYKTKINENTKRFLEWFFREWNKKWLWVIDRNTIALLSIVYSYFTWWDSYKYELSLPFAIRWEECPDEESLDIKFKLWWEYCDEILSLITWPFWETSEFNNIDEYSWEYDLFDDSIWLWKCKDNYSNRLNYNLSVMLIIQADAWFLKNDFSVKKYSYFYNEIKNV